MNTFAVLIMAAGESKRFADPFTKKPFVLLNNRPVWMYSAERFAKRAEVKQTIVVINPDDKEMFLQKYGTHLTFMELQWAEGGKERFESVQNGLAEVRKEIDFVAVHDAARPCVSDVWIDQVFDAAVRSGAAILANPITGTIKRAKRSGPNRDEWLIDDTVPRDDLWEAQTPQVFRRTILEEAYVKRGNLSVTDDAQLVQQLGIPITIVPCDRMNIKITTRADLKLVEKLLPTLPKPSVLEF